MRPAGESTLVDKDDAGIQSDEIVVTEAYELIEEVDESRRAGGDTAVVTTSKARGTRRLQ